MFRIVFLMLMALIAPNLSQGAGEDPMVTPELIDQLKAVHAEFRSGPSATYIEGLNNFGLELFKQAYVEDPEANRMYSPLIMGGHWTITANIVNSEFQKMIQEKFGWGALSISDLNRANKAIGDYTKLYHREYTPVLDYRIWADPKFPASPAVQATLQTEFGVTFEELNPDLNQAAESINKWVEGVTQGMLPKVVDAEGLEGLHFYVGSPFYLDAKWRAPFMTIESFEFETPSGRKPTPGMYADDSEPLRLVKGEQYDLVAIAYAYGANTEAFGSAARPQAMMWVVVPKEGYGLDDVVSLLSPAQFAEWTQKVNDAEVGWFGFHMPKWEFSYSDQNYAAHLEAMGLPFKMYSPEGFEYNIDRKTQKGKLVVAEEGTKMAFFEDTGVSVASSVPPYSVSVDRPFLFLIRDGATGVIMNIGVVNDPTLTE